MVTISRLSLTTTFENAIITQDINLHNSLPFFWADCYALINTLYQKLMKSMGSQSS
jgi:hypothetical protein